MVNSILTIESRRNSILISIGNMAKYCQTSVQTLRLYDNKGLIKPAYVDPQTHYRYYQPEQIFQFNLIKYLQSTNLSLQEINKVLNDESINLTNFWQEQERKIQRQIEEQQQKLIIAQFQQKQLKNLTNMREHLGKPPYVKTIHKLIVRVPVTNRLGPTDIPDEAVTDLDHQLLSHHQIPNLEYGFSFAVNKNYDLASIQYQTIFKELVFPSSKKAQTSPSGFNIIDVSGRYLCINFKWSLSKYLECLKQLLAVKKDYSGMIFEESFPLSYYQNEFARGSQAITELRIKTD